MKTFPASLRKTADLAVLRQSAESRRLVLRGTPYRRRRAFTLAELLVGVLLATLVAALLAPVLGQAVRNARKGRCAGNLRQIATLMHIYLGDHGNRYPYSNVETDNPKDKTFWGWEIAKHSGVTDLKWLICPEVKDVSPSLLRNQSGGAAYASYAINRYGVAPRSTDTSHPANALHMQESAKILLAFDYDSSTQPNDGWYTATFAEARKEWPKISKRHGDVVNVLFCDGHVSALTEAELFRGAGTSLPWVERRYTLDSAD